MSGTRTVASKETRPVFGLGGTLYTVRDVIDAADFRGELQTPWREVMRRVACENRATEEAREADDPAIESASQSFRYDHDLITAEETERWLDERGLTLNEFSDYFTRQYWGATVEEEDVGDGSFHATPAELRELFIADAMLSGEFDRMANRLSWRAAAFVDAESARTQDAAAEQRERFAEQLKPRSVADWLALSGRDGEWLDHMSALEGNYRVCSAQILTPHAREQELRNLRLQLTVFELEVIEFDSHDAACEALLCVREDNMSMEEVAMEGRFPFRREQPLLEDIPADVQQKFVSASLGELLEPMELAGAYRLYRVAGKRDANPDDPAVRSRIERRLLDRHFTALVAEHIHWQIAFH